MHLLLSALVHVMLIWFLIETQPQTREETIEIELIENGSENKAQSKKNQSQETQISKPKKSKSIFSSKAHPNLHQLSPHIRFGKEISELPLDPFNETGFHGPANATTAWGIGSSNIQHIEDFIPLERIREQTDGLTFYPYVLAIHNVSGNVNARLVVNQSGCDWKYTKIWGADKHLRIYILNVLKKLCRLNDLARFAKNKPKKIEFAFRFLYTEDSTARNTTSLKGNMILVDRFHNRSKTEWRFGPLRGLFPIPQVNLDFDWLQENWDRHIRDKEIFDDFNKDYGVTDSTSRYQTTP